MKISPNGTVIIFPTLIVYNAYIRSPDSAAIDNEDNIHLVWQYSSNINYMKIDNTGNTLISGRTILSYNGLDYPSIKIGTDNKARIVAKDRYGFTFAILDESANVIHSQNGISNAREPGFALDSSNSAFVIYLDDNYPDIRFTKLNSNGSVAIFNQKISDVDRWEVKPKALIDSNGFITFIWIDSISQNHSINAVKIDPSGNLIKGPVMIDSFTSMSWNDLEFSSLIDISDDIWISSSCSEDGYDTDLSEIFYLVVNSDDLSRSTNFTRLTAHGGDSVYPSLVAGLNNQTIEVVWVDYRYDDVVLYYKFLGVKISTFSANINDGATCSNVLAVKVTSTAPGTGEVYLDGSLITVLVLMNSSTFILDTTAYPDNLYNLTVAFMDVHGNVTVRSYMIEFNNTPVIPLSMNVNMTGGSVYTGLIAVVVTSNKPASGNVYLDGSRVNSLVLMNTTSFTINTAASTDGIHELTIFIQDSTGDNVSSTYSVEFYNPVSYLFLSSNMTAGATYSGWLTATVTSSKTATGSVYFDDTLIASLVFMKISPNGTVIIFPTLIVYNAYIRSPDSAAIDNEDNIHLVWQYSSNINYMKIDNTGNTLISGRTILSYNGLDYPSIKIGTDNKARIVAKDRYGFTFAILDESANVIHSQNGISNAREPGFALDSSNSAFVIYLDDNYPDIRFTKLNSNGSVAIFNQKISDVDRWEVKPKALIDSNGFITFIWIDSISQNHSINAVKIDPSGNLIKGPVMIDSFTSMSWNDLEFSSLIDISDDIWISSSCSEDGYDTDLSEIFYLVVNSDDLSRSTNFTRLTAHGGDSVYPSLVAGLNNQTIEVVWVDYRYDDVVLYYKFLGVKISTFSANINDGATCSNVLAVKVTSTAPGTGEVYLDGSLITVLVLMNSSTFILDTTAYPDNLYNLTVAFMDVHGNVTVRSYMIEFNNTPVIPLSMNVNMTGGSVYTGLIAVVVTSNKPASGNVYLDGSRVNSLVLMNTTSFTINTAASTDGIHELTIFIQDSTGDNVSSTYSVEFYNPVSYLFLSSNMTAGATYSGWLTATVTSSKTATGSVYFDDTLIASLVFMNTGSFSIDTAAYSDGEHNLTITATGMAGSGVTRTYLINFQNDYSNGTGTTSDGMDSSTLPFTPGFEVVTLLGALVTAVTILRRRKSTD